MIRKCNSDDLLSLEQLEKSCFKSPLDYNFLKQDIENNPFSNYLCYEENGVVIGYIGLWIADIGSIINLCVNELHRRKQIASMLLEEAIKQCENKEVTQISLDVRVSNDKARNLYNKYNFKEVLIRKNYYDNKEDAIVMVRSSI
ncbi:MAG: ribosomal protein S18-alanine N-acetyltransferase [bacterium]